MACLAAKGRLEPCNDSVGGIDAVYFINRNAYDPATVTYDTDGFSILEFAVADAPEAFKWETNSDGSNAVTTATSDNNNGTTVYEQVVTLQLKKLSAETDVELQSLLSGRPHAIVKDKNGKFRLFGFEYGLTGGGTQATGGNMNDLNGYTITLTAREKSLPNVLPDGLATDNLSVSASNISDI